MQIKTEVRSRTEATSEQVLRHFRGAAHIGLDDDVRNHNILRRLGFVGQYTLVQPVVQAREFARLVGGDQMDSLHAGRKMFGIAKVAPQTEKVRRESRDECELFLAG